MHVKQLVSSCLWQEFTSCVLQSYMFVMSYRLLLNCVLQMLMNAPLTRTFVSMGAVLTWPGVIDVNVTWDSPLPWMERTAEVSPWNHSITDSL